MAAILGVLRKACTVPGERARDSRRCRERSRGPQRRLNHGRTRQVVAPQSAPALAADVAGRIQSQEHGLGGAGRSGYLPVSEHGLIGDMHSVALVGTNGTIDWYCCPSFDSPSVFGSLLDADR